MANEILRSKHAFGNLSGVLSALDAGKIDAHDILFLDGDTKPKVGWIDKDNNFRLVDTECVVVAKDTLPTSGVEGKVYIFNDEGYFWNGTEFVNFCKPTDLTTLENLLSQLETNLGELNVTVVDLKSEVDKKANSEDVQASIEQAKLEVIDSTKSYTDEKAEDVLDISKHLFEKVKYEITNTPVGTIVDYREKEIRVMCPNGTEFVKQTVGSNGNPNYYYMGFKAYAPEGAVSFKEGDKGVVADEMFEFVNNDFAGTDKFGRNYSIVWLALASFDEATNTWSYFGKNSSTSKYLGWTYVVEWYDANGVMIASDSIRINLSNEECHSEIKPYYVAEFSKDFDEKINEIITELKSAYEIVEF